VTTDTTITALEEQLLQDRKDSTTLWQLQDNRTDRIFVCVNDEPHLYQPLRKQEAYTGAIDEDIAVASDVDPPDASHSGPRRWQPDILHRHALDTGARATAAKLTCLSKTSFLELVVVALRHADAP
jgi:hypothetical protein